MNRWAFICRTQGARLTRSRASRIPLLDPLLQDREMFRIRHGRVTSLASVMLHYPNFLRSCHPERRRAERCASESKDLLLSLLATDNWLLATSSNGRVTSLASAMLRILRMLSEGHTLPATPAPVQPFPADILCHLPASAPVPTSGKIGYRRTVDPIKIPPSRTLLPLVSNLGNFWPFRPREQLTHEGSHLSPSSR